MEVKGGECVRMNDRQQQLISLLCQRRSDSIQNLAMELGVCERTIRRDIEELTLTYPIETKSHLYFPIRDCPWPIWRWGQDGRLVLSGPAKTDSQTNSAAQTPSYWAAW